MTTSALPVPVDALRALVVEELDLLLPADVDHCATVAARRQAPLMRAVAERAAVSCAQPRQHLSLQWPR